MKKVLVGLVAVLAITAWANALPLADGGFENAGAATTIPNGNGAGNLNESPWKYDFDKHSGTISNGTLDPSATAQVSAGAQSLRINWTGGNGSAAVYQILSDVPNGTTINWSYAMKPVTTVSGYWYEIGYMVKVPNTATTVDPNNPGSYTATLIKKWDGGGTYPAPTWNQWNTNSGSFTLSGQTTSTVAFFVKVGGAPNSDVYFDNLTFTPEPAAVLLLGLPMLLVRRRRA